MKLVMTLLVRDEVDIVDATISYHLDAGIDFVIATDNGSTDGTLEILDRYARAGSLRLLREPRDGMNQSSWVTRMARLAAVEHGADWVINADADEFWWPRRGSLKENLARVPARFSTLRACMRNFLPRDGDGDFSERMTARLAPGELPDRSPYSAHPFQPQDKIVHRSHHAVVVSSGNHDARWEGSVDLRGWWPFEVLHFPVRSPRQVATKRRNWARHRYHGYNELLKGTSDDYFASLVVSDEVMESGLSDGWLVQDSRIRDALRAQTRLEEPGQASGPVAPTLVIHDQALFAADITAGLSTDSVVRLATRSEELECRLGLLEHSPWRRLSRGVRCASARRVRREVQ